MLHLSELEMAPLLVRCISHSTQTAVNVYQCFLLDCIKCLRLGLAVSIDIIKFKALNFRSRSCVFNLDFTLCLF